MQMSNLGDVLSKLVYSTISPDGGLGAKPPQPAWAIFVSFLGKKAILIPLDHISHVFTAI